MVNVYQTEEEQIEAIKRWFKQYGKSVFVGIIIAVAITFGWRAWQDRKMTQSLQASATYEELLISFDKQDHKQVKLLAEHLIEEYKNTPYAKLAALFLAKQLVEGNKLDVAEEKLVWVAKKAKIPAIRQIARIRAARILLAESKPQAALHVLHTIDDATFMPLINEVVGDANMALGKPKEAKLAYEKAIEIWPENFPRRGHVVQKVQ